MQVLSKMATKSTFTTTAMTVATTTTAMPTTTTTTTQMITENEHYDYENFILQYLQEINDKIEDYEQQLDEKKSNLMGFTSVMEKTIQKLCL